MASIDALRRGDASGARELRLAGCGLAEVPSEIFGLADTLEVLDLSGNALTVLPHDFGRLKNLRALFCSGNRFTCLPPALGDCAALTQVGFRGSGLRTVPAESLPPSLRWLTLTDNQLETLPQDIGARPLLQKLMLSGNRLRQLPASLAGAPNLELLRLSANHFEALPSWLFDLPRLAWLAWAGNPLDAETDLHPAVTVDWADLQPGALLGEGASGRIYEATWRRGEAATLVALKLFKGTMTSDGLPACEMAACLAAGEHPNLIGGLGQVVGHPGQAEALLMPLLPPHWRILAGPPSLQSCSRDVYDPTLRLSREVALRIAAGVGMAAAHLHARGLSHGDLYAHNTLWNGIDGDAVLSDFGAASFMPTHQSGALARCDVLAWGLLLGELLDRCANGEPADSAARQVQRACVQPLPAARPLLVEALDALASA
ncbi:leucine-rich repeat-containing protein kinase family protein [Beijerinckia sp. L45]|uniref:leucine-rich repeat-containing protein kinase family protein n=1 Tax=Beijerinckia sp. L45 TaxID=1641855 RepID=UPI001FED7A07|nr:leucine-rich repeat-containing protein kinase family protein [Beijerinckia sp. L45]